MSADRRYAPDLETLSEFLSPSLVISGRGSLARVDAILRDRLRLDVGTVLVAIDDFVLEAGIAQPGLDSLQAAGWKVVIASGFGSEPTAEVVDEAAAKARDSAVDAVVGIGGGSVLDSAKLIALLQRNEGGAADWLGPVAPAGGVAPLILVPTTSGTGSEATRIAMVGVAGAKRASSCPDFVPDVAIIDPDLVATLPRGVVAATGMDALAHAIESLMSTTASPSSADRALTAIGLLIANLEAAAEGDQAARAQCHWAAHLAGQALNAGVVVGHSIAYCVAFEKPMPHGTSCALALPYTLAFNRDVDADTGAAIALAVTRGASDRLQDAATAVFDLTERLGLPISLDDAGVPDGVERRMAQRLVAEYPRPTNPRPIVADDIEALMQSMRTGNLDAAFLV